MPNLGGSNATKLSDKAKPSTEPFRKVRFPASLGQYVANKQQLARSRGSQAFAERNYGIGNGFTRNVTGEQQQH
jgi:hypothetical protein